MNPSIPNDSGFVPFLMSLPISPTSFNIRCLICLPVPHRFAVPHRPTLSKASLKSTIDDYAVFAMAEECSDDGECSIEQAENLMNEVLSIQANCVASIDEISPICNEALLTSELIVGLRAKIKSEVEVNTFLGKVS